MKRKLYETSARLLAGGARDKGREDSVWALGAKRIRFRHETYTSWLGAEFASSGHGA